MIALRPALPAEDTLAMEMIDAARRYFRSVGVDQWQQEYPSLTDLQRDIAEGKGYFAVEDGTVLGYLCVDFDGEPAYNGLKGEWLTAGPYAVIHRLAFSDEARGRGRSGAVFALVDEMVRGQGVCSVRADTDGNNAVMRHVMEKNGYTYRGDIWFDYSPKAAYEKLL